MGRNIGKLSLCVKYTMPAQCLHDGVVEDLLWNSLRGNVLKQRGKDRSLEDLLPQKMKIVEIRLQLPQPILSPRRRLYEPEAILKNETEDSFPISSGFIHIERIAGGMS